MTGCRCAEWSFMSGRIRGGGFCSRRPATTSKRTPPFSPERWQSRLSSVVAGPPWWRSPSRRASRENIASLPTSPDASRVATPARASPSVHRTPTCSQLATDLNAMIERLVGLLAVQERFIAHAAHELRTPLTSLRIELELALRTGRDRRDYEGAVRGALESARRLTICGGSPPTRASQSRAERRLDRAGTRARGCGRRRRSARRMRDVFILTEPFEANVGGDRRGLARLFRNLLENAVRFSPPGGRVRIESRLEGERVVVTVTDGGPGIAVADEERVFEPFAVLPVMAERALALGCRSRAG